MNLLTIDVGTVAGLATHVWSLTNAVVICEKLFRCKEQTLISREVFVGTAFMYRMFGIAAFIGIACVPLSAPASIWVAKQIYSEWMSVGAGGTCR
jgi:hypothetical protein